MTTISKELKEDLRKIVVDYFPEDDAVAFNRDLLEDTDLGTTGVGDLSEADRAQLEIEITPVQDRFHIDRTITLARKKLKTEAYLNLLTIMSEISVSHGMLNMAHEIISKIKRECRIRSIKANAMIVLSDLMAIKGKWEKSIAAARNARNIYEIENNKKGLAKSNNIIGTVYGERGNLKKAGRYFEQSLELAKAADDKKLIASLQINLGIISNIYEEYDKALSYFNDAYTLSNELGEMKKVAETKHNIALVYKERKEYEKALDEFDIAINLALNYRYQPILAISYIGKAEVLVSMKSYKLAALVAGKAMDFAHTIDDKLTIAEVYRLQGIIYKHLETYKLAENKLKSALRLNKNLDIQLNIAECYGELASLSGVKNNTTKEKEYLMLSLDYYKKIDSNDHIAEIENRLINIAV